MTAPWTVLSERLAAKDAEIAHLRDLNREALQRIDGLVADMAAYVPAVDAESAAVHISSDGWVWVGSTEFAADDGLAKLTWEPLYRKVTPGGAE